MNKHDYMEVVNEHGFGFHSWLEVLPCYDTSGKPIRLRNPVPIVCTRIGQQAPAGFKFQRSTLHYVCADGYQLRALVKQLDNNQ